MKTVIAELDDEVLSIELNRPDRLNAVSEELYKDLIAGIADSVSKEVRVVLLSGRGRAFCAGADLKAHAMGRSPGQQKAYARLASDACRALLDLSVPVVGAVHGYAIGAGAELALCCDLLVVTEDVAIRFPETALGTYFGGGVTWALPRMVGLGRASELLLLGRELGGREAADIGLATEAVPPDRLISTAREYADRLKTSSAGSLAHAKAHLRRAGTWDRETALEEEESALIRCMGSSSWARSVDTFAERFSRGRGGDSK